MKIISIIRHSSSNFIDFELNLDKNLFSISGDYNQIFQVLMNILTNAVESMPIGGKIKINTKIQIINLEKSEFIRIEIADQGVGIAKDDLAKIFDPFFTTKRPTDKQFIRGLGLSMVHRIVQNHNGMIEVVCNEDLGTTFKIYLPKGSKTISTTTTNIDVPIKPKVHTKKKKSTKTKIKKNLILVIEDNVDLLEIMKIRLERENIKGIYCNNPLDGITKFKENKQLINLVVLDYLMPEMTGLEVFRILKEIEDDIKVILVTGYAKDAIKSKDIGIIDIMSKPLNYGNFLSKIYSIIK